MDMRYVYALYRTKERAEAALEHMFAAGEVSEGEFPKIERKQAPPPHKNTHWYAVTRRLMSPDNGE